MHEFERLVAIMRQLRAPGGCPWDAEQTHHSIANNLIEEAFEAHEAILTEDMGHLCEELGDVLLQVVFHGVMAEEAGSFTLDEVIGGLSAKLIHRHPHVFAETSVKDAVEVTRNWEQLKSAEKGKTERQSILDGIPSALPALYQARKMQTAAARVGFDWPDMSGVVDKINEEAAELKEAVNAGSRDAIEDELGDLLFSLVNLSRFLDVDPEAALKRTNRKFRDRFGRVEQAARESGVNVNEMSLAEMDAIWEAAKRRS